MSESIGVLIVDDHPMFAQSLARVMADEADIDVVGTVSTPKDVLPMVAALEPDIVLVDYHMPDQNGIAITRELAAHHPWVRVLMITGSDDDRILVAALEAGCAGLLTKTRGATEVADAVRTIAAGEAMVPPNVLARLLPRLDRNFREIGADLTTREREVLAFMVDGASNAAIAEHMDLSVNTIRNYVQSILSKLGVHSKLEAVGTALRERIVEFPVGTS